MPQQEELIAKKEVLEKTKISYGQFYRWKRKGLIPEAWFIRKSTFTGQETFLPKDKIMERITKIKELKDQYSLDEIAEMLSPQMAKRKYHLKEVMGMNWLPKETLNFYHKESYDLADIFCLGVIAKLLNKLTQEEIKLAISTLRGFEIRDELDWSLIVARKDDKVICCVAPSVCIFDPQTMVEAEVKLNKVLEEIKLKLREWGGLN
jgi:DNA-binding transcriptional MerR regulator